MNPPENDFSEKFSEWDGFGFNYVELLPFISAETHPVTRAKVFKQSMYFFKSVQRECDDAIIRQFYNFA